MPKRVVPTPFPAPLVSSPGDFGAAVRAARTGSGLTLEEAATALGVAKQTLQSLERGTANVGLSQALRIARAMGVTVLVTPATERDRFERLLARARPAVSGSGAEAGD